MDPKALIVALGLALGMAGCSDSSSQSKDVVPDSGYGTDSLDALSPGGQQPAPAPTADDDPVTIDQGSTTPAEDQERDWIKERESQSLLGRSRDKAKDLRNDLQGGTDGPDNGFAATTEEDEWVGTTGYRWDMPDGWKMAIPGSGRFGEMYIQSDFGAATVAFTKEDGTVAELERRVAGMLVDMIGSKITPKTESLEVDGRSVKLLSLEGTYIDPSSKGGANEKPFYAVRGAVIDLGTTRVLVVLWGPEDTVKRNESKFSAMIKGMYAG
jgi:hypothetical protein